MKLKERILDSLKNSDYITIDTDCSWFFLKKTDKLEKLFKRFIVDIRELTLPKLEGNWYKFNVDLILTNSPLLNELTSNSFQ